MAGACRLCLERPGTHDIYPHLAPHLLHCAGLAVSPDDNLPDSICNLCLDAVYMIKNFRDMVAQNDSRLRGFQDDTLILGDNGENPLVPEVVLETYDPEHSSCQSTLDPPTTTPESNPEPEQQRMEQSNEATDMEDCGNNPDERLRPPDYGKISIRGDIYEDNTNREDLAALVKEIQDKRKTNHGLKVKMFARLSGDRCKPIKTTLSHHIENGITTSHISEIDSNVQGEQITSTDDTADTCHEDVKMHQIMIRTRTINVGMKKEEDLTCEVCWKHFETYKQLYAHRRQHIKQHDCPVCKKAFATKNDLRKHTLTHTGEKPYKCSLCEKGFTQKGTMKAHEANVCSKRIQQSLDNPEG